MSTAAGEPTNTLYLTIPRPDNNRDYVVANGRGFWFDVPDDWTTTIDDVMEPSAYICEQGENESLWI